MRETESADLKTFLESIGLKTVSSNPAPKTYTVIDSQKFTTKMLAIRDNAGWKKAQHVVLEECDSISKTELTEKWLVLTSAGKYQQYLYCPVEDGKYEKINAKGETVAVGELKELFMVNETNLDGKPRQLISYGAPGTGKSFKVNETTEGMPAEDVVRTTFHPDSDYATFVGAYKPVMEVDDYETVVTTGEKTVGGTVTKKDGLVRQKRIAYEFVPQSFMQAYVRAWRNIGAANGGDAAPVVLVIEEINRGNCAQIFGDLFQLLDRNDDGWSSYAINADVDLARWLKDEFAGSHKADGEEHDAIAVPTEVGAALPKGVALTDVVSGRKLLLPPNLYIWATMNTSDQSLFPIDSAFKRRWDWKYVPIAKPKDKGPDWKERTIVANGQTFDWWRFLEIVNAQIFEATKSEDKQLGYFFVKAPDATGEISASQFTGKVLFYLYNDVFRDETPPENLFGDGSDGTTPYRFRMFFDEEGEAKEDVVAAFLTQLFAKNPEKGKSEASASEAAKGTDVA